jgi:Tfp pilus assembly protein PilX
MITSIRASMRRRLRDRRPRDEAGFAMVTVLGIGTVMTALMLVSLAYAVQVSPQARRDQNWTAALGAAQAGVDDYVSRLNKEDSYALKVDCTNTAMAGAKNGTNTCGWTSTTLPGWRDVTNGDPAQGQFHYDLTYDASTGSVRLLSTGRVRSTYRTINVRVARGGSTDFLYYTDFEDADPENTVVYPGGTTPDCGSTGSTAGKYWYQKAAGYTGTLATGSDVSGHRSGCVEIAFAAGDVLDGRVHFNDTPGMGGATTGGKGSQPTFSQGYETADPNCPIAADINPARGLCWRYYPYPGSTGTTSGKPYFGGSAGAKRADKLDLPDNSAEFVNYPGCQYWGDTRIRFNADGTMTVWNIAGSGKTLVKTGSPSGTNCGNASAFIPKSGTQKYPAAGQTVPVPTDMVVYVRNSGAANACLPGQIVNGSASSSTSSDVIPQGSGSTLNDVRDITYFDPSVSTVTTKRTFTKSSTSTSTASWAPQTFGYTRSVTAPDDAHAAKMDCGQGNVYVEGTVNGRVTIAAENNVVVTNDLLLRSTTLGEAPSGTDIAGLVAANSVQVYHPVSRGRANAVTASSNNGGIGCNGTVDGLPTSAPFGTTSVTCTWADKYTYNTSYGDLAFPGATSSGQKRWIYSSIQTLQHSFLVQSYSRGADRGTLSVRGSIAQRYRGIVRSGSAGYLKDYSYDSRLKFQSPPFFPQWTNAVWSGQTTGELKPQYVGQ